MLAAIDETCVAVDRDPSTLGRTVAVLVRTTAGTGRDEVDSRGRLSPALTGSPDEIAHGLRAFADLGISHVQLVIDPITLGAIEELAPALERYRQLATSDITA
jgi:alkanesulfonate monooxygenase SsuD/methylene tetrahydromethanopterin reductase-like flavin-dependent oxidoreductase (luciferase family)